MPIYMNYDSLALKGDVQAATSADPEYRYVNVRRVSAAEDDATSPPGTGKTLSASLLGQHADGGAEQEGSVLVADPDPAAGTSLGTTVIAWARVDGTSGNAVPFDPGFSGGVFVGAGDDVVVDGRIITAENPAALQHELGHTLGFRHEHSVPAAADDTASDDIIVAVGPGGGPHVKVFDGAGATDGDNDVDGRDFLVWQRGGPAGSVGGDDLANRQSNFGSSGAAAPGGAGDDLLIGGLTGFGDAEDRSLPTEQLALNYTKVDWTYDAGGDGGGTLGPMGDGSVRSLSTALDLF